MHGVLIGKKKFAKHPEKFHRLTGGAVVMRFADWIATHPVSMIDETPHSKANKLERMTDV